MLTTARIDGLIPAGSTLHGSLECSGTLWVDAEVHGDIRPRKGQDSVLIIGPHGKVFGSIEADRITIYGQVVGRIRAHGALVFEQSAHIVAEEIAHKGFTVRTGARVEGTIVPKPQELAIEAQAASTNIQPLRSDHQRSKQQPSVAPLGPWRRGALST